MTNQNNTKKEDNIIISGIPYEEKENLQDKILNLAAKMNIKIENYDVNTTHRLDKQGQPIPTTIVTSGNCEIK